MAARAGVKLHGPALREIRRARALSVTDAAKQAGVTQGTWSNWEAGRRQVSFAHLRNIAEVLHIEDLRAILYPTAGNLAAVDELERAGAMAATAEPTRRTA